MTETALNTGAGPGARGQSFGDQLPEQQHDARRWLVLAVIGLAQLMIVLDVSIVNIALPDAQKALSFNNADRQWIVTAYSLAFGALLLFGGRLADLVGRKQIFIAGLFAFAAASFLGGISPNFGVLVTARAIQGAAGALLAPAALSLLITTFTDVKERAKAFAVFGAIAGSGAAIGLLLGGVLTEYLNWRWTLFINVGLAVFALAGAFVLLRAERSPNRPTLDLPGTLMVSAGLFCIVYGFSNAQPSQHGWNSPATWGFLAAGGVLLAAFCFWQTRAEHPLLPLRIILDRDRGGSFLAVFITGIGMFGVFLFLTYYLQTSLLYSPVVTGLAFLPMIGTLMVSATLATTLLLPRIGPKWLVGPGMLAAAAGMVWLTPIGLHSSYAANILGPLLLAGVGLGFVFAPAMNSATFGVQARDAGVASATVNTMQQVGGSIGTALLNTLATSAATAYAASHVGPKLLVEANAAVHSYVVAFWWSAAIFAFGAVVCTLLLRPGVQKADPDAAPTVHM
ncbi:MAG TPA: MFS transporter [Actinocrinis sp.]|jgi:EmrB/QacA subfamily drug resistance transporter